MEMQQGASNPVVVGFIGLGAMGLPMAINLQERISCDVIIYDIHEQAMQKLVGHSERFRKASSPQEVASASSIIVSMLPNDSVLESVCTNGILASSNFHGVHFSCSTVHPSTSRKLASQHRDKGAIFIGSPVFARADGVARREASFVVGGDLQAIEQHKFILEAMAQQVFVFGSDPGAGNVVKLCGNFMIASAIESCAEACSLAEQNGVDRVQLMKMLTTTIFDCLIYKGYGMRTAERQHLPNQPLVGPGFALELGLKDVSLTRRLGRESGTPLPLASLLEDRFLACQNKYCSSRNQQGKLDWSAVGLLVSEEAGIEVEHWLPSSEVKEVNETKNEQVDSAAT